MDTPSYLNEFWSALFPFWVQGALLESLWAKAKLLWSRRNKMGALHRTIRSLRDTLLVWLVLFQYFRNSNFIDFSLIPLKSSFLNFFCISLWLNVLRTVPFFTNKSNFSKALPKFRLFWIPEQVGQDLKQSHFIKARCNLLILSQNTPIKAGSSSFTTT